MKLKTPAKTPDGSSNELKYQAKKTDRRSEVRGSARREAHSVAMKAYWEKRKAAEKRAAAKLARDARAAEAAKLAKAVERKAARQAKRAA